jgi:hypothetical protein
MAAPSAARRCPTSASARSARASRQATGARTDRRPPRCAATRRIRRRWRCGGLPPRCSACTGSGDPERRGRHPVPCPAEWRCSQLPIRPRWGGSACTRGGTAPTQGSAKCPRRSRAPSAVRRSTRGGVPPTRTRPRSSTRTCGCSATASSAGGGDLRFIGPIRGSSRERGGAHPSAARSPATRVMPGAPMHRRSRPVPPRPRVAACPSPAEAPAGLPSTPFGLTARIPRARSWGRSAAIEAMLSRRAGRPRRRDRPPRSDSPAPRSHARPARRTLLWASFA